MLLYLTSNQKSNLIDPAVRNMTLPAKKLVGRFSLKSFVTKDMRNYANAKFFVVDAACIEESGNDFTLALQSFQMMFSARIIVILSGCEDVNGEVQRLLSIGVVNLVIPKFAGCIQGSEWFKERGQWQDGSFTPEAGHIIFFDWEGDGLTDHVGIVERVENGTVYTVEGNSGDACRQNSYSIGSSVIYGYGIPAY